MSRLVVLLALLFLSSPLLASARSSKHFKPGKYYQAALDEYAKGAIATAAIPPTQPQQILTSLTGTPGTIVVTWVTMARANTTVQWGSSPATMDSSGTGSSFDFVDPEPAHGLRVIHTARLTGLKPKSTVSYRVGDAAQNAWSDALSFTAPPNGDDVLNLLVYGDLGLVNSVSIQRVIAEVDAGTAHMVLHLGDYAYDLHTKNGTVGDTFMNNIQPMAARVRRSHHQTRLHRPRCAHRPLTPCAPPSARLLSEGSLPRRPGQPRGSVDCMRADPVRSLPLLPLLLRVIVRSADHAAFCCALQASTTPRTSCTASRRTTTSAWPAGAATTGRKQHSTAQHLTARCALAARAIALREGGYRLSLSAAQLSSHGLLCCGALRVRVPRALLLSSPLCRWFSWEYLSGGARVHFVAINSEMYFDYVDENPAPDYSAQRAAQYAWLDADLAKARASADWVIVYGHRPMYCSDVDSLGDCTSDAQVLREGYKGAFGMDAIIAKHHVDLYFGAHEHSYERIFPVYAGRMDPQQNHTHRNPLYPVHIITGSAGCSEGLEWFDDVFVPSWSVVRSGTYGYGHLRVHNATHLYWEQLLDEGKQGLDTLWIVHDSSRRGIKTGTNTMEPDVRPWISAD